MVWSRILMDVILGVKDLIPGSRRFTVFILFFDKIILFYTILSCILLVAFLFPILFLSYCASLPCFHKNFDFSSLYLSKLLNSHLEQKVSPRFTWRWLVGLVVRHTL